MSTSVLPPIKDPLPNFIKHKIKKNWPDKFEHFTLPPINRVVERDFPVILEEIDDQVVIQKEPLEQDESSKRLLDSTTQIKERKLSHFVYTSPYAKPVYSSRSQSNDSSYISKNSPINYSWISKRSNNISEQNESFIFKVIPRYSTDNNYKASVDFPDNLVQLENNLLQLSSKKADPEVFYKQFYQAPQKDFDPNKLQLSKSPGDAVSVLKEVQEVKSNQARFHKWKDEMSLINKRFRVQKNAYKTGILALDSPMENRTHLYDAEQKTLKQFENKKAVFHDLKKNLIQEKTKTNPIILADNKNKSEENDILPENRGRSHFSGKSADTKNNLFGVAEYYSPPPKRFIHKESPNDGKFDLIAQTGKKDFERKSNLWNL